MGNVLNVNKEIIIYKMDSVIRVMLLKIVLNTLINLHALSVKIYKINNIT